PLPSIPLFLRALVNRLLAIHYARPRCDGMDHLIAQPRGLWESWSKVLLRSLKSLAVRIKVSDLHCVRPGSRGKCEFQVISAELLVREGKLNAFVKQLGLTEKILCCAEPDPEKLQYDQQVRMNEGSGGFGTGVEQMM